VGELFRACEITQPRLLGFSSQASPAHCRAEVGGDWKTRSALGWPVRYFEADHIPAQLVLDEGDLVVEVNPWPFISART
jgi:hypothetical protein